MTTAGRRAALARLLYAFHPSLWAEIPEEWGGTTDDGPAKVSTTSAATEYPQVEPCGRKWSKRAISVGFGA